MKHGSRALIGLLLLAVRLSAGPAAAEAGAKTTRPDPALDLVKSFPAKAGQTFSAEVFDGSLEVTGWAGSEIEVTVHAVPNPSLIDRGDQVLSLLKLNFSREADEVSFRASYDRSVYWSWEATPAVILRVSVKLPRGVKLAVDSERAAVNVTGLKADIAIENRYATTYIAPIKGNVRVRSVRGNIELASCTGDFNAVTGTGRIVVGRVGGKATLRSKGTEIEVQQALGGIDVTGSGTDLIVGMGSPVTQPARLVTTGGNITLKINRTENCVIDTASSPFGSVRVINLPVEVESGGDGRSHLLAAVNTGGPRIVADAHGGSVFVRGVEPLLRQFGVN